MKSEINDFKLFLKEKNITNDELLASKQHKKGDYLGVLVLNKKRTTLSRFVNHSDKPNIEFIKYKNKKYPEVTAVAQALKIIKINKELLVDYRNKKLI